MVRQAKNRRAPYASRLPRIQLRWLAAALGAVLLVLAAGWGIVVIGQVPGPALTRLVIRGNLNEVNPTRLRAIATKYAGSGFFQIDLAGLRQALESRAWVDEVQVRRIWPDTLVIEVAEQVPVAIWGRDALLNGRGEVFHPDHVEHPEALASLPQLEGPKGSQRYLLDRYADMNHRLAAHGVSIRRLVVSERRAWQLWLTDGIRVRLGRGQASARLVRFADLALPALAGRLAEVAYVDMRYTNGFAVGWQAGKDAPDTAAVFSTPAHVTFKEVGSDV